MKIRNTPYLIQRAKIEDLDKVARLLKDEQYVTQVKEGKYNLPALIENARESERIDKMLSESYYAHYDDY